MASPSLSDCATSVKYFKLVFLKIYQCTQIVNFPVPVHTQLYIYESSYPYHLSWSMRKSYMHVAAIDQITCKAMYIILVHVNVILSYKQLTYVPM